jgi:hypothetical protein
VLLPWILTSEGELLHDDYNPFANEAVKEKER